MKAIKYTNKKIFSNFKVTSGLLLLFVLGLTIIGVQNRLSTSGKASSGCVIVQTDQGPGCWCASDGWKGHCANGQTRGDPPSDQCLSWCASLNTDAPPDQKYTCVENLNNNGRDFGSPCSNNFQFSCGGDGVKTECIYGTWHDTGQCCPKGQVGDVVNCRKITNKDSCVGQCAWYICANGCYRRGTDKDTLCPRATATPRPKPTPTPTSKAIITSTPSPSPRISLTPTPSSSIPPTLTFTPTLTPIPTSTPFKSPTPTLTLSPTPVSVATGCEISITLDGPMYDAHFGQKENIKVGFNAWVGWRWGPCMDVSDHTQILWVDGEMKNWGTPLFSDTISLYYSDKYKSGAHFWWATASNKFFDITSNARKFIVD